VRRAARVTIGDPRQGPAVEASRARSVAAVTRPPDNTWAEPKYSTWSTFGPHAIGAERLPTVSSGRSFAQVAGATLRKQARGQNPDKDEVGGSSPPRPTSHGDQPKRWPACAGLVRQGRCVRSTTLTWLPLPVMGWTAQGCLTAQVSPFKCSDDLVTTSPYIGHYEAHDRGAVAAEPYTWRLNTPPGSKLSLKSP
jgi:hypothetical protein